MFEAIAAILAIVGAYFVGCNTSVERRIGFILWILSNALWVIYGVFFNTNMWIALQFGVFLILAIRGVVTNVTN